VGFQELSSVIIGIIYLLTIIAIRQRDMKWLCLFVALHRPDGGWRVLAHPTGLQGAVVQMRTA
jgi:hypothetical protein